MAKRNRKSGGGWSCLQQAVGDIPEGRGGVYMLRLVTGNGAPKPIPRFRGRDPNGILYVGCSKKRLAGRIQDFEACASGRHATGHVAGRRYYDYDYSRRAPLERIEISWQVLPGHQVKEKEHAILEDYQRGFLDLPPLNHSG